MFSAFTWLSSGFSVAKTVYDLISQATQDGKITASDLSTALNEVAKQFGFDVSIEVPELPDLTVRQHDPGSGKGKS